MRISNCYVLIVAIFGLLSSCGVNKESTSDKVVKESKELEGSVEDKEDQVDIDELIKNGSSLAKVVVAKEGCKLRLVLADDDNCYYPVNLPREFQVDGAKLVFQKFLSRAPLPEGCESCIAISVENIVRIKR